MIYYSKTSGGFYDSDIHGKSIPDDAVQISDNEHADILAAQSSGKVIRADADGNPVAVDAPPPSAEMLALSVRVKRDALLASSDWIALRAVEAGTPAPADWKTYRQALRDVPAQKGFPKSIEWPKAPTL